MNEELLAQHMRDVARGDRDALLPLFEATSPIVLRLCRRLLGPGLVAEEVVVEIYEQVWRRHAQYDPQRGSPLTWLLVIARGRALDRLRADKAASQRAERIAEEPSTHERSQATPDHELVMRERNQLLDSALAALTPLQRKYVESSFLRGVTHEEIAKRHKAPLGTVKSTIRTALLALRQKLRTLEPGL